MTNPSTPPDSPQSDSHNSVSDAADGWCLEHSYATLPDVLHVRWHLNPVQDPRFVILNRALATELGLNPDRLSDPEYAKVFSGNELPPGGLPLTQAYAGHQFGGFTNLGDGRALLLGEQITPDGRRMDIQLKGSGRTPFSRGGDGRAALGPMLREYIISEAMHALGIPTTRSLAVTTTGEPVFREDGPLQGAVLTRVAASHIRVGTFEFAAAHDNHEALQALTNHALYRHYPEPADTSLDNPAAALLKGVIQRQAQLIARWMHVGFVHGVMNTDNMTISGETIDYGPCAFMDVYDPGTVFSSIDRRGRYAYGKQPSIAQWNLVRFAESLLPLLDPVEQRSIEIANSLVLEFASQFKTAWLTGLRSKLGLIGEVEGDELLGEGLFEWMKLTRADFTNTFLALTRPDAQQTPPFSDQAFVEWHRRWIDRLGSQNLSWDEALELMRKHNPVVIPRNHKVEEALGAAVQGNLNPLHRLLDVLGAPFDHQKPLDPEFTQPAPIDAPSYKTFCGT